MNQQTSDHLSVLMITYQSEIPERYDFEIVEPIKEDSEIAIALYLKSEKELLRYESSEIDLLKIETWLADVASKIYMIDKVVEIYEPSIIVDDS